MQNAARRINASTTSDSQKLLSRDLRVEYLSLNSIKMDASNPRIHDPKQVRQIARSIETFGFSVPILIDSDLKVIAGHGRLQACRLLRINRIPAIRLNHLTATQKRAFMIAENRLAENSAWDKKLLGEHFKILSEVELNFSAEVTGFTASEIDIFVENFEPAADERNEVEGAIPENRSNAVVTRAKDCWILDRHRVRCDDARQLSAYFGLMQGRKASMVFADPPYNIPIDGYVTGFGKIRHSEFGVGSGEMSKSEFTAFLQRIAANLARQSINGALHYICMDWRHSQELLAATQLTYSELKNICVWVKENAGQGSLYRSQHEFVFVFKYGTKNHKNNIQLGQFGRYRTNVWNYRRVNAISQYTDESSLPGSHPTIKPVELVADAVLDCTSRRDIVLDPFLGSGTTLIAAERTGRICYGVELDPHYVDIAVRRWQTYTGKTAIRESTGMKFAEIEEDAHAKKNK